MLANLWNLALAEFQINDRFGHALGDEGLAAVGTAIKAALRESDFAGRIGGEKCLILLPDTGLSGAEVLAEKLRLAVATITVPGVERAITASLGSRPCWSRPAMPAVCCARPTGPSTRRRPAATAPSLVTARTPPPKPQPPNPPPPNPPPTSPPNAPLNPPPTSAPPAMKHSWP